MNPFDLHPHHVSRRHFFRDCGVGLGKIALAGLLTDRWGQRLSASPLAGTPAAAAQSPHFPGRAKRVIHLFMGGAPSQLDLFDHKPELAKLEGRPLPPSVIGGQRYAFIRPDAAVLGPRFKFARHGQCGTEISEVLPHLGKIVDDICLVRSVRTDQFNHAPAQIFFNTGFSQPGRPSLGSWVLYGLGSESQNLPAFVVMSTGGGLSGGAALWSSGFLPTVHTGVRLRNQGPPILNVDNPAGIDTRLQRDTLDLVADLNQKRLGTVGDPEIATRIASYEMAFRLQTSAPELMDLRGESPETLKMYGCDPAKPSFARACLLARRMIERGSRFVTVNHFDTVFNISCWDMHADGNSLNNTYADYERMLCPQFDLAYTALIEDLDARGLLQDTVVAVVSEMGRTPRLNARGGRDHHPACWTNFLAGGGIKGGQVYGASDKQGGQPADNPVEPPQFIATIYKAMGIDLDTTMMPGPGDRPVRLIEAEPIRQLLS